METCLPAQQLGSTEMHAQPHEKPRVSAVARLLWPIWGSSVWRFSAPSVSASLRPHVSYCAHCFQMQFCFWETERKSVSMGRFWCFPAQWKFQKRHPHAVCYKAKVILEIPVKWKHPHLRSSLTPWEFYPWCGKENKKLRIKSWCEILCRALGKFHHLSATELGINRQLPKSDCSTRLVRLLRYSTVAAGQNHA